MHFTTELHNSCNGAVEHCRYSKLVPLLSYNGNELPSQPKRKTVVAAGLLCIALTVVVLFTSPSAFRSSAAVIVMALIGTAAVLLQMRFRSANERKSLSASFWLNLLGVLLAVGALFPAAIHIGPHVVQAMVLGAVGSLAISSALILHSLRKHSTRPE